MRDRLPRARRALSGWFALALGLCIAPLFSKPALAQESCVSHAVEAERKFDIPSGLLVAISLVESGQDGEPNAFALSIHGRAVNARNTKQAAHFLRDGHGRLKQDVYVGCMQLSLDSHRTQFQPIERIVEPRENVFYAARLLVRLHGEEGSWKTALARYNGGSPRQTRGYVCKVWRHLNELDGKSAKLLESAHCDDGSPSIAPSTRRTFQRAQQVAAID